MQKVRSAITKLDNDGVTNNIDNEMVLSNSVMSDNEPVDSIGAGMATSDENDTANDVDTGKATSKQMKMNGKESNLVLGIQDKSKHLEDLKNGVAIAEKNMEEERTNEARFKKKVIESWKKGRKRKYLRGRNEVIGKNAEKPEASNRTRMKDKASGMIFMCSSKTKKDCYDYKVLGLPPSKRDIVSKIYEGMRLFLFDYDLKLMHGIFKAAGPGGYNIEPKAFNSEFPSQVRFTVLKECSPLAEEDFKEAIKDNYYRKNKFHHQLTSNQVKNLCKLFKFGSNGSKSKRSHENPRAEAHTFVESKQPRRSWKGEKHTFMDRVHRSPRAETRTSLYHGHRRRYGCEEERHNPLAENILNSEFAMARRREINAYRLPLRRIVRLPPASMLSPSEIGIYRRDELQHHDHHLLGMEFEREEEFERHSSCRRSRYRDEAEHHDYHRRSRYQDEFEHLGPYRGSGRENELPRHDFSKKSRKHQLAGVPSTSSGMPPEYCPPASRAAASKFHLSAGRTCVRKHRQPFHKHRHWHQHQHQHRT